MGSSRCRRAGDLFADQTGEHCLRVAVWSRDDDGERHYLRGQSRHQVSTPHRPAGENQSPGRVIEPVDGDVVGEANAEPVRQDVRDDRHGITEGLVDAELAARLQTGHAARLDPPKDLHRTNRPTAAAVLAAAVAARAYALNCQPERHVVPLFPVRQPRV